MIKKNLFLLALIVFVLFLSDVPAQKNNLNPIDPKRESASATLKTFFNAFQQPRVGVTPDPLEEAVKCLDLRGIPAEFRAVEGLETAAQIKEALDVVENFHIEDAPTDPNADPYFAFRSNQGEIILARQDNGEWLFTQETVRSIPVLVAEIEKERILHGTVTLMQQESVGAQIREQMPTALKQKTFLLERWQWIGLVALFAIGLIVWRIVKIISGFTIGKYLRRSYESFTDEQITGIYSPLGLLACIITFRIGLRALALNQNALTGFRTAMFVLTAIAIIWFLYKVVDVIAYRLRQKALETESQLDDLLVPFFSTIVRIVIVIIGAILVAENLQYDVTGLIAGLGIGGIAIALASQETLSNFFGSLVLLIEQPFRAEDRVEINEVKGIVKEIGLRSTKILTYSDSLITLPNSTIAKSAILNDGIKRQRRWVLRLTIAYQEFAKIEKFCEGIRKFVEKDEKFDTEAFKLHLFDLAQTSVVIRIHLYFNEDSWTAELEGRHQFIAELLKLADKLQIKLEIPV